MDTRRALLTGIVVATLSGTSTPAYSPEQGVPYVGRTTLYALNCDQRLLSDTSLRGAFYWDDSYKDASPFAMMRLAKAMNDRAFRFQNPLESKACLDGAIEIYQRVLSGMPHPDCSKTYNAVSFIFSTENDTLLTGAFAGLTRAYIDVANFYDNNMQEAKALRSLALAARYAGDFSRCFAPAIELKEGLASEVKKRSATQESEK